MSYDAYLSYDRESGAANARYLQASLMSRGSQCFLDIADMGSGASGVALLEVVAQLPNFIVILSPGALDRCAEPQDWLRQEIGHALRTGSNIIPVIMPGFAFPPELPEDIRGLTRCQGVQYNLQSPTMFAEILMAIVPALPLKLQYRQAVALAAQQGPIVIPPPVTQVAFNWTLAGLLFLAEFLPSFVTSFFQPPSLMLKLLGHAFFISIAIALVTTLVLQTVPNPYAIAALCGLNLLVATYLLGVLFFGSVRLYAFGLISFLYGVLVPGSIAVARIPRAPRWTLLVAPLAGATIYTILALAARVPGFDNVWQLLARPITPLLMGGAFFIAVKTDQNVNRV